MDPSLARPPATQRLPDAGSGRALSPRPGGDRAREALVERFLPLARKLARRYHQGGAEPLEDLVQVASLGLVKAARRYDERRGVPFAVYASTAISGELKRHFRDHAWALHVPRGAKERALEVRRAARMQPDSGGRPPSAGELARRLHMSTAEILAARETWLALDAYSLDAPAPGRDELESQPLGETIGLLDDGYERVDDKLTLEASLPRLPTAERRVLHMRFVDELTQADIAQRLGVSQMHISRVLRRALARLESVGGEVRSR